MESLGTCQMCHICCEREARGGKHTTCCGKCKSTKGQEHDVECHKNYIERCRIDNKMKADLAGAMRVVEIDKIYQGAKNADDVRKKMEEAWEFLKKAMRIDDETMAIHDKAASMMGLVKMMFLAVIVGCELDLYAFIMSWPGYWNMPDPNNQIEGLPVNLGWLGWGTVNITVIKLLLVVGPIGYLLSVIIFLRVKDGQDKGKRDQKKPKRPKIRNPIIKDEEEAPLLTLENLQEGYATKARQKINLRYFHFLPIVRYYLLIKDTEPDDMEGLFRVNALSTFTLGVAQIVCMMFHQFVVKAPWTIFIKVGIFTQCWNIVVTLLYFLTPLSAQMMAAIAVDTLKVNVDQDMMNLHKDILSRVELYAITNSQQNNDDKKKLASRIDREIAILGGLVMEENLESKLKELGEYELKERVEALGCLR